MIRTEPPKLNWPVISLILALAAFWLALFAVTGLLGELLDGLAWLIALD